MELIYGSTAIKHWYSDFNRTPKDVDILTDIEKENSNGVEFYCHPIISKIMLLNKDEQYLDSDLIYTFKISHLSYPINWDKHMKDVIFLQEKGCVLNYDVYLMLMELWEEIHSEKYGSKTKINLNTNNQSFFNGNVKRKYDHDWLHEQFAFYDRPLHESIRSDMNNPFPVKEKWDALSHEDKIKCALEECYVVAFERFSDLPYKIALIKSIKKLITTMTKGWFNLFLKENFKDLINFSDEHYKKVFSSLV